MKRTLYLLIAGLSLLLQHDALAASAKAAEGRKVVRIRLTGDGVFDKGELRAALRTQKGDPFRQRDFRADLASIVDLHRSEGYLDARIVTRDVTLDDRGRADVEIGIQAGPRWSLQDARIEGLLLLREEEVRKMLTIRPPAPLIYRDLLDDARKIQEMLVRRGMIRGSVEHELSLDPTAHAGRIVYHVHEGPRVRVGEIRIEPEHRKTAERVIRRHLLLTTGQYYDLERVAETRRDLSRTGLFRSVSIRPSKEAAPADTVQDLVIHLEERRYLSVDGEVGVTNTRPRLTLSVQHDNWLGRASRLGATGEWDYPKRGVVGFYTEPNLLGLRATATLSSGLMYEWHEETVPVDTEDPDQVAAVIEEDEFLQDLLFQQEVLLELGLISELEAELNLAAYLISSYYDLTYVSRSCRASIRFTRPLGDQHETSLAFSWDSIRDRPDGDEKIVYNGGLVEISPSGAWRDLLTRRYRYSTVEVGFQRDSRDDRLSPGRGEVLLLSGRYARGLRMRVWDWEIRAKRYQPTPLRSITIGLSAGISRIRSLKSGWPIPSSFWKRLGGEGSVRGVARDAIRVPGGGRSSFFFQSEIRWQPGRFGVVPFLDGGGVWKHVQDARSEDLVYGYGIGFRFDPGLRFRLDLGFSDRFRKRVLYVGIGDAF